MDELPPTEEEEEEQLEYLLDEEPPEIHLTQDDYDRSKVNPQDLEHEKFGVSATQYQDISDTLLAEVQRKYELRSRTVKVPEPNPNSIKKNTAKKPAEKETKNSKPVNKPTEKTADKSLDKSNTPNTTVPKTPVEKPAVKPVTTSPEIEKTQLNFNLENELAKLKIPIPLSELAINPAYKPKVEKWMTSSNSEEQPSNSEK